VLEYVSLIIHCAHKYALWHRCYIAVHLQFYEMVIQIGMTTLAIAIHKNIPKQKTLYITAQ